MTDYRILVDDGERWAIEPVDGVPVVWEGDHSLPIGLSRVYSKDGELWADVEWSNHEWVGYEFRFGVHGTYSLDGGPIKLKNLSANAVAPAIPSSEEVP